MMPYNKFHINCPHFNVGNCTSFKTCKYKYHKKCDENFLCNREDCKYGHGISYMKRVIINYIYDEKYSRTSSVYEYSSNKCKMPMNCINKDCEYVHHLEYDDRSFIYNIINPTISDENAWSNYVKKYSSYSPNSSTMSYSSTVPAMCSPCQVVSSSPSPSSGSFASLFKEQVEDNTEDDSIMTIIEDMKNIRNNIDLDTKKVVSIKDQIKKLQEELVNTDEKIKKNKNNLKELAIKIADC